jgi:acyl dehydratase
VLFAGIDKVRFKRVVAPGETLDLYVEVTVARSVAGKASVEASRGRPRLPRRAHDDAGRRAAGGAASAG